MKKSLRACALLTSLGFAFYGSADASATTGPHADPDRDIRDRLASLRAAQDTGAMRIEIVGKLRNRFSVPEGADPRDVKTADWLQTFNNRFKDRGKPS